MTLYLVTPLTEEELAGDTALFSGEKVLPIPDDFDYDGSLIIKQSRPVPLTVLFIARKAHVY